MLGLREEAIGFLAAVLAGAVVTCSYLCLCKLRRVIRHGDLAVAIEDVVFWAAAGIYIFTQIYQISSGSIRWYFVVGALVGMAALLFLDRLVWGGLAGRCEKKQEKR